MRDKIGFEVKDDTHDSEESWKRGVRKGHWKRKCMISMRGTKARSEKSDNPSGQFFI